jgi:hypothetical protein
MSRPVPGFAVRVAALASVLAAGGCAHRLHWPWHHSPPPPPAPVHELDVSGVGTPGEFPQYWKRNTLLVDLSGAGGAGSLTLKPVAGGDWPVRLALRVPPGRFGVLEVRGAERLTLPIDAGAGPPVDLELPPGVYRPDTAQITVSWGPASAAAP